ncbi:hypothetical protein [Halorubrum yunnanense]|uniref:Uncharacterized protein n=1 Tax=Halorubrum yunnanense TaxID=1526162 RepID=A0ABD5YID9_9EURY
MRSDHGIAHVDVDVTDDGETEYFAVGSRAAGLGPTLAPGSAAVAVSGEEDADTRPGDGTQRS